MDRPQVVPLPPLPAMGNCRIKVKASNPYTRGIATSKSTGAMNRYNIICSNAGSAQTQPSADDAPSSPTRADKSSTPAPEHAVSDAERHTVPYNIFERRLSSDRREPAGGGVILPQLLPAAPPLRYPGGGGVRRAANATLSTCNFSLDVGGFAPKPLGGRSMPAVGLRRAGRHPCVGDRATRAIAAMAGAAPKSRSSAGGPGASINGVDVRGVDLRQRRSGRSASAALIPYTVQQCVHCTL